MCATKFTARKKQLALRTYAETGSLRKAALAVEMDHVTLMRHRDADLGFASALKAADEEYVTYLEEVADARATATDKPSDLLLIFRLKGKRPQVYRDNASVDVTVTDKRVVLDV